jgi:hypothetical protein
MTKILKACACAVAVAAFLQAKAFPAHAQSAGAAATAAKESARVDEKAEAVVRRAVEVVGGRAFLDVRSIVSEGYYTPYNGGTATLPIKFADYLVFPDRERTEFRGANVRSIQTYDGEKGWLLDGIKRSVSEATPEQVTDFRVAMRTSLDNVLRGWWRAQGAKLSYAGRREAGLARRNEAVRLVYPDGFSVDFEFDARTGMPARVAYKKRNVEGEEVDEEDRYAQFSDHRRRAGPLHHRPLPRRPAVEPHQLPEDRVQPRRARRAFCASHRPEGIQDVKRAPAPFLGGKRKGRAVRSRPFPLEDTPARG